MLAEQLAAEQKTKTDATEQVKRLTEQLERLKVESKSANEAKAQIERDPKRRNPGTGKGGISRASQAEKIAALEAKFKQELDGRAERIAIAEHKTRVKAELDKLQAELDKVKQQIILQTSVAQDAEDRLKAEKEARLQAEQRSQSESQQRARAEARAEAQSKAAMEAQAKAEAQAQKWEQVEQQIRVELEEKATRYGSAIAKAEEKSRLLAESLSTAKENLNEESARLRQIEESVHSYQKTLADAQNQLSREEETRRRQRNSSPLNVR